jgi:signal transduction histidine kinase
VRLFLRHLRGGLTALALITCAAVVVGRDLLPIDVWVAWSVLACANVVAQAFIWRAMEAATSLVDAIQRWLVWLTGSIVFNGVVWGSVPLLAAAAGTSSLVIACLFNAMLLFAMVSAPSTPAIAILGSAPIATLGAAALILHGVDFLAGVGYVALIGAIGFYGARLQWALRDGIAQRHAAQDLAGDLRSHQQRLIGLERERTLLLERQRLTRDIHDGLGSTLVSLLAAVERGNAQPARLAAALRECLDDLRAVIDSLEPIDHDLVALLANLRFRMEHRLSAAGVRLEWQMADLPELPWLGATEALHVTRIVQEVLTNVVKHAGARCIEFKVDAADGEVVVCIADDGNGFRPEATYSGRGLKSLPERAACLGGRFEIDSQIGAGTRVRLRLPVAVVDRGCFGAPAPVP